MCLYVYDERDDKCIFTAADLRAACGDLLDERGSFDERSGEQCLCGIDIEATARRAGRRAEPEDDGDPCCYHLMRN